MNKVFLKGNITNDPTLAYTKDGIAVCNFTIAVNEYFKDKQIAEYIDCVAFNNKAETISQHFIKGQGILVMGKIKSAMYKKDDITRKSTKVYIETFEFMGRKTTNQNDNNMNFNDGNYDNEFGELIPSSDGEMPF